MKEELKHIIKQTVDNHSDDINPDMIWNGIKKKLGKKKRSRFAGYWIFGGFSLFTAFLVFAFILSIENSVDKSSALYYTDTDVVKDGSNEIIEKEKSQSEIGVVDRSAKIENFEIERIELNDLKKNVSNSISNIVKEVVVNKSIFSSQTSSKSNDTVIDFDNSINEDEVLASQLVKSSNELNTLSHTENRLSVFVAKVQLLRLDEFDVEGRIIELGDYEEFVFDSPYVSSERSFKFLSGIELYSGLSTGEKTVSDVNQSYAKSRNDSEKLLEQWSAGVRFDLIKVMDFQLQSGIRYSMITDKMQMVNEYKDLTEYTYKKSRLVDGAIVVIDSMMVMDSIGRSHEYTTEQYNSQRVVSIPLEVSFGKRVGKLDLGIGFGVDINYQLSDTHVILGEDGKATVNKVGGNWVSPSFNGAFLVGYHLNDKWSITSRLNFRGLELSDHETISTLKSNYKLYGLELGLKRNFGN